MFINLNSMTIFLAGCGKRVLDPLNSALVKHRINNLRAHCGGRKAFFRNLLGFLGLLWFLTPAFAQFGGRKGDVVIYIVNSKGQPDLQAVPDSTVNTQSGFEVLDPASLPLEPFGPDFPSEYRRKMHAEPGDVFNAIIHVEGDDSPHQELLETVKVFLANGLLRLKPRGQEPVDVTAGLYVPFAKGIDFGPNEAINPGLYLMWTPAPFFPATRKADPLFRSPVVPAEYANSIDYLLAIGTYDTLIRWISLDSQYPGANWKQGIDSRVIERDSFYGTTISMLRLRPGRTTPLFKINANTHMWVLSGKVTITPANGSSRLMKENIYSFVPPGFAFRLSNPADYEGPQ
jgi:hypothetical protein